MHFASASQLLPRALGAIVLCASVSACATNGSPRPVANYYSARQETSSLGSELVAMSDEEAHTQPANTTSSRPVASSEAHTRRGKLKSQASTEETTISSTATEQVVETVPISASNNEILTP